jgi:hypothetical protein
MTQSLTPAVFQIDAAKAVEQISSFIEAKCSELHRDGALVSPEDWIPVQSWLLLSARWVQHV